MLPFSRKYAMRWLALVLVAALGGLPVARAEEAPADPPPEPAPAPEEAPKNLPPLQISIDRSKVDLEAHRFELKMSRKAGHVSVKVFDELGAPLAEHDHDFSGRPANAVLTVTWSPSSADKPARIEVYAYDAYGYFKGVALIPWSLSIPHEEVNFENNSAAIPASEESKLEDSLTKIRAAVKEHGDLGKITLFIAGHTDRVGAAAHNLNLSRRRARAIAAWFRKREPKLPIAFEGFGEFSTLVKTEDEVAEPRNRRADYVLSIEEPAYKTTGRPAAWKRL